MKTAKTSFGSTFKWLLITTIGVICISTVNATPTQERESTATKNVTYTTIVGKVIDSRTSAPIVFANISIAESKIGTISNSNGEFELKIPSIASETKINFTHLGYKSLSVLAAKLVSEKKQNITLEEESFMLSEVVIKEITPNEIITYALENRSKNYTEIAEMQTAFYRETLKKNSSYVGITEAVLSVYKSGYSKPSESDRVKIIKARKGVDVTKMDTLIFKLSGGPKTSYLLDVVKNPESLFTEDMFEKYIFTQKNFTKIDDELCYVIGFNQSAESEEVLYSGVIFISVDDFAIVGAEFQIAPSHLKKATKFLITKRPSAYKIELQSANYMVSYKYQQTRWHLSHVRSNMTLKAKKRRQLFSNSYSSLFEMAVTDNSSGNVVKPKHKESSNIYDVLSDQVSSFEDDKFWGNYNIIKPDESIEAAIKKLNRKLIKQRQ